MKPFRIIAMICSLGLASCGNDAVEEPPKLPFFTLNVEPSYPTDASENWVLASTPEGEWLDFKPFEAGQVIQLESSRSDIETFFVHFLSIAPALGEYFQIESYGDVPNSFIWTLKSFDSRPSKTSIGEFTLNVQNYPHRIGTPDKIVFTDGQTRNLRSGSQDIFQTRFGLNLFSINEGKSSIFISSFRNNLPVYLFLRDVPLANLTLTKDFNSDFIEVENKLQIDLPGNTFLYCQFAGFFSGMNTDEEGFIMSEYIDSDGGVPPITLGYTNHFDIYRSIISTSQNNLSRTYEKLGSPVTSAVLPSVNINLVSANIKNFQATIDRPFEFFNSEWQASGNQKFLNWYIKSKQSQFIISTMPTEIINKHPFLGTVTPNLRTIGFTQTLDNYKYENLISNRFSRPTHYYFFGLSI